MNSRERKELERLLVAVEIHPYYSELLEPFIDRLVRAEYDRGHRMGWRDCADTLKGAREARPLPEPTGAIPLLPPAEDKPETGWERFTRLRKKFLYG